MGLIFVERIISKLRASLCKEQLGVFKSEEEGCQFWLLDLLL